MKGILLDENLPAALELPTQLPVNHVAELGTSPSDTMVWSAAKAAGWIIVTKDADFLHRSLVSEPPPWIVQLKFGNLRLRDFKPKILQLWPSIEAEFPAAKVVLAYPDRLEIVQSGP